MKKMRKLTSIFALASLVFFSACENRDWSFPDYDYTTAYFSYQRPVRTLVLGNDEVFDNSLDNQHKCKIMATMGGVYENETDRTVEFAVNNSLCDGLYFGTTDQKVEPMPSNYYELAANQIVIPKGEIMGGVEVHLTDAFFADPKSTTTNYVIPLEITAVQNIDSVLAGQAVDYVANPDRVVPGDWIIEPKDYILYGVKYVNPWDGILLRRGVDQITVGGTTSTNKRSYEHIEDAETVEFTTNSLTQAAWALTVGGTACNILLDFSGDDCTLSSDTPGVDVSGSGKFVEKGEKNSFNGKDRDVLYLDYTVDLGGTRYATKDTLVMRDRQVAPEWFTVSKQ